MTLDLSQIRSQFPSLDRPVIFFDNPGGTQIARQSLERINRYLLDCNANHEGAFATSKASDAILDEAHRAMADFYNAASPEEIQALLSQALEGTDKIKSTARFVRMRDPTTGARRTVWAEIPFEQETAMVSWDHLVKACRDLREFILATEVRMKSESSERKTDQPQELQETKPPLRHFASRIEGGPEARGTNPQLLVGKKYDCVFGVKAEADPRRIAAEIPPEDLAKMQDREIQVLAGGEGLGDPQQLCVPQDSPRLYLSGGSRQF